MANIEVSLTPLYLFVRGAGYQEGNYLTNLFLTSKEQVLGGKIKTISGVYVCEYQGVDWAIDSD